MSALRPANDTSSASPFDEYWMDAQHVGGVRIVATTVTEAATAITTVAKRIRGRGDDSGEHVHLASAQTIALATSSAQMDDAVNADGWVLPDGKPITWISNLRGDRPALSQTRGIDVFAAVCRLGVEQGVQHYLLGSTPDTLRRMKKAMRRDYPGIRIVGSASPPFRPATAQELARRDEAIRSSGAHVVWVGLGTPKQDFEVARLAHSLPVVAVAVGAVFDFAAGILPLAPRWMSRFGLEWLFRLISEPRRLWRRYTLDSSQFLLTALFWGRRRRVRADR